MSNVWSCQIEHDRNNIMEKPVITTAILIRFNDVFSQTALAHIQNTNKLSFLKSLKGVYTILRNTYKLTILAIGNL